MSSTSNGLRSLLSCAPITRARGARLSRAGLIGGCAAALALPLAAPAQAATEAAPQEQIHSSFQLQTPAPRLAMLEAGPDPSAPPASLPTTGSRFSGPYPITPERRALLNTIRYAEGTWANGQDIGYRIMFGGGLAPGLERHPDRVIRSGGYASAAAGAYQFMPFTWSMASRMLGLQGFGPDVQDQAALLLVHRRGGLSLADQGTFTRELAAKLAPEWASFPTMAGHSFYGQPVKRYDGLRRFYENNLAQLRAGQDLVDPSVASVPTPPPAPPCNDGSLECALRQVAN